MSLRLQFRHRSLWGPLLMVLGVIALCAYGTVAAISDDPLWFAGKAVLPDPVRLVIRVDGRESLLTPSSEGYEAVVAATRKALSAFRSLSPGSAGLSQITLIEYQQQGTVLELYCDRAVDFHLPFNDGRPTALLIPVSGPFGERGYVFRGRSGEWWAGQLTMSDPQPIRAALAGLGFLP